MRSSRAVVVASSVLLTAFTAVRDPDTLTAVVWSSNSVTMVIQQNGSADISDGSDITAMRDALGAWGSPACTSFQFVDGGVSASEGDFADGVNRISFLGSSWSSGSGVVALTTRRRNAGATPDVWTEGDIIVNDRDFVWATDGDVHSYDIQTTVTHELGHVLGLWHSPLPQATMYFGARRGLTHGRTLHADDIAAVCFLYPQGTFNCAGDDACPLFDDDFLGVAEVRTRCSGGSCISGTVGYGETCFNDTGDCDSGLCMWGLDAPAGFDPGFCTVACTPGPGACASGDLCRQALASTGMSGNLCHLARDDCVIQADCVGSNRVCELDLDGRFRCLNLCEQDAHCSSVPGTVCHGGTGSGNPAGFCRVPGAVGSGEVCDNGLDCQSLYCAGPGVQPTCTGTPVASDGAPPQDGAPPADAAPPQDGSSGGDSAGPGADGSTIGDQSNDFTPDDPVPISGGCACDGLDAPGAAIAFAAVMLFATRRRRRTRAR